MLTLTKQDSTQAPATAPQQGPQNGSLSAKGLLVEVTLHQWVGRKRDSKAGASAAKAHGAKTNRVGAIVDLIGECEPLEKLRNCDVRIGQFKRARTLPWTDRGPRLLGSAGYFEFTTGLRKLLEEREGHVAAFAAVYPHQWAKAQNDLGGLFYAADFPHPSKIAERFTAKTTYYPLPDAGDIRCNLTDTDRAEMQRHYQAIFEQAQRDVWKRVIDVVGSMVERLVAFQPKTKTRRQQGGFQDSLVENIRDLIAVMPALNVADDPRITEMIAKLATITVHDAEVLKESPRVREQVRTRAEEILAEAEAIVESVSDFL
jgi:hypothetical protein